MTQQNKDKEILEEFDSLTEDIYGLDNPVCCERHDCLCSKITNRDSIKSFISKALKAQERDFLNQPNNQHDQEVRRVQREEIVEMIEKTKLPVNKNGTLMYIENEAFNQAVNERLDWVINHITNKGI